MTRAGDSGRRHLRGAVIVTGTEVLAGRVTDRNGPWVSQRFAEHGVETAGIVQVGDRREDLLLALAQVTDWGVDVIATTGGLGPTADDLTMEVVAEFCGAELTVDDRLEADIWERVRGLRERYAGIDVDSLRATTRKQALQPAGGVPLDPVGTAPGTIVSARAADGAPGSARTADDAGAAGPRDAGGGPLVVVLPGPPRELQPMWEAAAETEPLAGLLASSAPFEERMLRLVGLPESDLAASLTQIEEGGVPLDRLEITTCMRSGEIEIVTRYEPEDAEVYAALDAGIRERYAERLYSDDGSLVDGVVRSELERRGWTVAFAESCTGGLIAAKMIEPAGASKVVLGGVVAYANEVKQQALGVPAELIAEHGAVSGEVAEAMVTGVCEATGADCGLAVTGIAGPGGGTEEKPVGTVWIGVKVPGRSVESHHLWLPGDRSAVRERTVVYALHALRRALQAG